MPTPLELFFALAWDGFLDHAAWEGPDLQDAIEACGLGEWRAAEQSHLDAGFEGEIGDPILVLTDAGKAVVKAARAQQTKGQTP